MSALRELQRDMASAIRDAAAAERLAPRPLAALATPQRLAIHARNYRAGLTAALASIFPGTRRLTGEGFFAFAAAGFIAESPPRDPIVAHYGDAFPAFLAGLPALAASRWVAEAARLEWTVHALGAARPTPPCDLAALSGASDARVVWSPAAILFDAPCPAADLIDSDGDLAALDLARPCRLLLAAAPDGVVQHALSAAACAFLQSLRDGARLSDALAAHPPSPAFDPPATLRSAARLGAFAAITPV